MAKVPPGGTVSIDNGTSFTRIYALGRTMTDSIDKKQRITGFYIDLYRPFNIIDGGSGMPIMLCEV
jgi:hypothetical protein